MSEVREAAADNDTDKAWEALIAYYRARQKPVDPNIEEWKETDDAAVSRAIESAAKKLASWRVNGKIDWEHNKRPPRKDWEKYWGRGRLRFIAQWARAATASGNSELRNACAEIFLEWYRDCPAPRLPVKSWWKQEVDGFAWREIEVGIRGRLLISLFMSSLKWKEATPEFHSSLLISIQQHMNYLTSHYAKMGPHKGNHQTHHAPALLAAGILLPELKGAAGWERLGMRILREHVDLDLDSQGVQKENSPHYHVLVLEIYLDPYHLLTVNGMVPPTWMKQSLDQMADFMLHATAPDGRLFSINDAFPRDASETRRLAARILERSDLLAIDESAAASATRVPATSRSFKHAAFAFMRSSWKKNATCVVLDASRHASGHWHAGKPNLIVHAGDQILACDPQLATYDDPSFYTYFHTAQGHNTVLVDGKGDGTPKTAWKYATISHPKLTVFRSGKGVDIARASTDGFKRLKKPASFERTVVFVKPNCILVHDLLTSKGEHTYEWLLHLVPQKPVVLKNEKSLMTALGGPAELICSPVPGAHNDLTGPALRDGKYANRTAGMSAGRGKYWLPPGKGEERALLVDAPYGVWTRHGKGRVAFDFVLQVLEKGEKPSPIERINTNAGSSTIAYHLTSRNGKIIAIFDDRTAGDRAPISTQGLTLNGRVGIAVTTGKDEELLSDGKLQR